MAFGDHPRETNWGLVNMVSRYYSPRLGRFVSPDSMIPNMRDRRSFNPFAYVEDAPTAMLDPTGHEGQPMPPPQDPILPCSDWQSCKKLPGKVGNAIVQGAKAVGRGGSAAKNAVVDLYHWATNPGETVGAPKPPPATVSSPPATSTSTSSNGAHAPGVPRAAGPTEAGGPANPAGDALGIATSALRTAAEHTPVPVWAPPSFGQGYPNGLQFDVTAAELEGNGMLKGAAEGLNSPGLKAVNAVQQLDQINTNGQVAMTWLESITKFGNGDIIGGTLSAWEGAFLLAASKGGEGGAAAAAGWGLFKINLYLDFKMGSEGATFVPDAPGVGHWEMPAGGGP
jgi:RHS repeat-associated protein